jgi:hypothetical protein
MVEGTDGCLGRRDVGGFQNGDGFSPVVHPGEAFAGVGVSDEVKDVDIVVPGGVVGTEEGDDNVLDVQGADVEAGTNGIGQGLDGAGPDRADGRGVAIDGKPVVGEGLNGVFKVGEVNGLDEERGGAELIGLVDFAEVVAGGEDDDAQLSEGRLGADPFEDVEAAFARHLEVEEKEIGHGEFGAGSKAAASGEISDGLFAVGDKLGGACEPELVKSAAQHGDVVVVVFSDQNHGLVLGSGHMDKVGSWRGARRLG